MKLSTRVSCVMRQCREFIGQGAKKVSTPLELIQSCDLIFSCVSDSAALKDVCPCLCVYSSVACRLLSLLGTIQLVIHVSVPHCRAAGIRFTPWPVTWSKAWQIVCRLFDSRCGHDH